MKYVMRFSKRSNLIKIYKILHQRGRERLPNSYLQLLHKFFSLNIPSEPSVDGSDNSFAEMIHTLVPSSSVLK